jgi:hypothetical protein
MTTNDKEYMREYMKKRYNDDKDKAKKYQKALRWKTTKNISNEMWEKYKHNLVEVIQLQGILNSLSIDIVNEVILNHKTKN